MRATLLKTLALVTAISAPMVALAASDVKAPKEMHWSFDGAFGTVDRQAAQRGFQVYKEVCASCHGLGRVAFRSLKDIGFAEGEIKALAAEHNYSTLNDAGETVERPGLPSDKIKGPFANEQAARAANNGAYPPDLSLMIKARPNGANYVYSLLTGYEAAPADVKLGAGMNYNPYFPGHQIAMAAPLSDGQVTYADGTASSADQLSRDVVNFLQWAAEPEMEARKRMGIKVMIFLSIAAIFFYIAKQRVWARVYRGEE